MIFFHSALNYLSPRDYYRGDPEKLLLKRREATILAREHRRRVNIGRRKAFRELQTKEAERNLINNEPQMNFGGILCQ